MFYEAQKLEIAPKKCVCVNLDTNLRNKGVPIRIRVSMRKVCVSFIISDEIFFGNKKNGDDKIAGIP